MDARRGPLRGNLVGERLWRIPGARAASTLPSRRRGTDALSSHAQRLGVGAGTCAGGDSGDWATRRWLGGAPIRAACIYGYGHTAWQTPPQLIARNSGWIGNLNFEILRNFSRVGY